jgi:hypothetical protein
MHGLDKRIIPHTSLLLACSLLVMGCQHACRTARAEAAFNEMVPGVELNESARLRFHEELHNEFIIGGGITLLFENLSDTALWFDESYGARLFWCSPGEGQWVEVRDKVIHLSQTGELLGFRQIGNYLTIIIVQPDLPPLSEPVWVRVVVVGQRFEGGKMTGEKVGAYKDVLLFPR